MRERILVILFVALSTAACIVEAPGISRDGSSSEGAASSALKDVPPLNVQNGAILDDKVEIIGSKIEPGKAQPGDRVKVTTYYRVLEEVGQEYLIFVHVEDVDGKLPRMNYDHVPAGGAYPTTQWKKGNTIQDTFEIQVPPEAMLRGLNVWAGFWHAPSDTRMPLRNPEKVRHDGKNRILLATIPVGG